MADDNKILLKIQIEKGGSTVTLKNFENQVIKSGVAINDLNKSIGNFTTSRLKIDGQVKVTTDQFKRLEKSVGGFKTAAGASTSATLELGRVLSDMPYGIRGVANNLQQLASNLFFMSKATDVATGKSVGFVGAVGSLVKGLVGPAGILIAFQGVIALFDYFSTGSKKAADEAKNLQYSMAELESTASKLHLTQGEVNGKLEDYIELTIKKREIAKAEAKFQEELLKIDKELAENRIKASKSVMSEKEKELSSAEAVKNVEEAHAETIRQISILETKRIDILTESYKKQKEIRDAQKQFDKAKEGTVKALQQEKSALEDEQKALSTTSKKWDEYAEKIIKKQAEINEITGITGKNKKITPLPTDKEFELQAKSILSKTEAFNKEIEMLSAKTAEEKLAVNLKYEEIALKRNKKNEIDKLDDSFNKYKADLKKKEVAYEKSLSKNKDVSDEDAKILVDKYIESNKKLIKIAEDKVGKEKGIVVDNYEELFELFEKLGLARVNALAGDEDEKASTLEKIGVFIDAYKELMGGVTDFLNGEFDRQLTIEQNKTNSLNAELNNRLNNENLSKDQRASIQNEIAKNDEKLRLKQDAINRKKFNQQKAFNIASAVIDTYAGAAQTLADKKLSTWAKIPMMISIIGSGLAQVAAISRQKFQSSSANTPINTGGGGSSSSGERAEPTFNIVGSATNSAVVDAIQSRFDQPLKAYVVSREITSQQEMDTQILDIAGT